ncbi:hypothetical protein FHR84_000452 [Actinopolyspora biskrensis]|uniref:Uncharacterized protein n=1 Tax=Actinopolyspora biskrensis TaxID=1470178 RepID=A0A852YT81_9ACTN|nr:hypothetical protein [Actinopolyspora biskrensis]NYH77138.1 hypothetical protein [Actinopolyspora biskrensis]
MRASAQQRHRQRRARLGLSAVLGALAVLVLIAALVTARSITEDRSAPSSPTPRTPSSKPSRESGNWNVDAQQSLAAREMAQLPPAAARPHPLSTERAGPPITLPAPERTRGQWIPTGFPDTPRGALAQLAALDETAMRGGDPGVYARGYRELALDGAPNPESTGLYSLLTSMRSSAGLKETGSVPDLRVGYEATHGQIKGTTDNERYVVACVLGQFSVDHRGRTISAGVGDCQALRHVEGRWRISPGPLPAAAPSAWPGSSAAVRADYRPIKER